MEKYIKKILSLHFDEENGSRFWLSKKNDLDFDPTSEINSVKDFSLFKYHRSEDIRDFSVEELIPKKLIKEEENLIVGSSGGRTGKPKWIPYSEETYNSNLNLLEEMIEKKDIRKNMNYLFIGPTGPHLFGRRVRDMCERRGGIFYTIDFDPRWIRNMKEEKKEKYINHILDQTKDVVESQNIDVIFTTPGIMARLPESEILEYTDLNAVGFAGMPISPDEYRYFQEEVFNDTALMGYYGNAMYGVSPQVDLREYKPLYQPPEPHAIFEVRDPENIDKLVEYGERGRIIGHRISPEIFMPNFIEEDGATRIEPAEEAVSDRILNPGVFEKADGIDMGVY